ncbi:MAG: hypothetical protein CL878_06465 [Dehalococcoidia bacterium]|nr:hypothetical protein [Dehalococcoidia bacterium]
MQASSSGSPTADARSGSSSVYSEDMSAYSRQPLVQPARAYAPVRRSSYLWSFLRLVILAPAILLVLVVSLIYVYRQEHEDRIYPGIAVLGFPVGRSTRAEAEGALRTYVRSIQERPLTVRLPDETIQITLGALGLNAADEEIARLVDVAWWVGRDLPFWSWLAGQVGLVTRGYDVPGSLTLDTERTRQALQQLARQLDREPVNATLQITNFGSGFVSQIDRPRPGQQLDVEETLSRLQRGLAGHLPTTLDLVLVETAARITEDDLDQPRAAVDSLLRSPLILRAGGKSWSLEPDRLFSMLDTEALAAQQAVPIVRLIEDRVRAFVAGIAAEANDPSRNPSLRLAGGTITLEPGRPGEVLDELEATRLIIERAFTSQRLMELPLVTDPPSLTEAALEPIRRQVIQRAAQPLVLSYANQQWVLEGQTLLDMVSLSLREAVAAPPAQATATTAGPASQRPVSQATGPASESTAAGSPPTFELELNSARVETFISEEVAPKVAQTVEQARFELRGTHIEVIGGSSGVVPNIIATRDAMAAALQRQSPEERVAAVQVRAARPEEIEALLEPLRQQAERLVARPLEVRYGTHAWSVAPAELATMLRFRQSVAGPEPYFEPDRLDARVAAIAVEARQFAIGPSTADGRLRPVDVPMTAESIWQAVQSPLRVASVEFLAAEDLPPPGPRPGQSAPWIPAQ